MLQKAMKEWDVSNPARGLEDKSEGNHLQKLLGALKQKALGKGNWKRKIQSENNEVHIYCDRKSI